MTTSTTDIPTASAITAAMSGPAYLHLAAAQTKSLADASANDRTDTATLHSVTPILPAQGFDHGHHDVLVIAFTAETFC